MEYLTFEKENGEKVTFNLKDVYTISTKTFVKYNGYICYFIEIQINDESAKKKKYMFNDIKKFISAISKINYFYNKHWRKRDFVGMAVEALEVAIKEKTRNE